LFEKVKYIKITCGYSHQAALDQFGRLFTWGDATEGALGHPEKLGNKNSFKLVDFFNYS